MDYFCAFAWPYETDQPAKAKRCFDALAAHSDGCPVAHHPYEVSLAESVQGSVFVGVLVLPGTTHDDSVEIYGALKSWFQEAGVKDYQDYSQLPVHRRSTDATLGRGYRVLAYFGNVRGSGAMTTPTLTSQAPSRQSDLLDVPQSASAHSVYSAYLAPAAPLCDEHEAAREKKKIISWSMLLGCILAGIVVGMIPNVDPVWGVVVGTVMFLVGLILRRASRGARPFKIESGRARDYAKEVNLSAVRPKAEAAWHAKDYAQVVELYGPIREDLTEVEAKKLAYARSHARRKR
jgi:hypothetical protein